MPAIEHYEGPLWRTLRHCDPDGRKVRVAFVSALWISRCGFPHLGLRRGPDLRRHDCRRHGHAMVTENPGHAMAPGMHCARQGRPRARRNPAARGGDEETNPDRAR